MSGSSTSASLEVIPLLDLTEGLTKQEWDDYRKRCADRYHPAAVRFLVDLYLNAIHEYNPKLESRSTFVKRRAPEIAASHRVPRSVVLRNFEWVKASKLTEYRC